MKTVFALFLLLLTSVAEGQTTNALQPQVVSTNHVTTGVIDNGLNMGPSTPASRFNFEVPPATKANELLKGKVTLSGSAVEAVKTKRPLQLVNPLAPPQYGSPEDNVARDPVNGKVTGLKIFAIKF